MKLQQRNQNERRNRGSRRRIFTDQRSLYPVLIPSNGEYRMYWVRTADIALALACEELELEPSELYVCASYSCGE